MADSVLTDSILSDRAVLMASALGCFPEGIALLDATGDALLWNQAAEIFLGYQAVELMEQSVPEPLVALLFPYPPPVDVDPVKEDPGEESRASILSRLDDGSLIHVRHKLGHDTRMLVRYQPLNDELGTRIGMAVFFHPVGHEDALPRGSSTRAPWRESFRVELEERLKSLFRDCHCGGDAFGVLWIAVDRDVELRRTHGVAACEAMLASIEETLSKKLRASEEMGRWGDHELLVIAQERSLDELAAYAQSLAALARTAKFRWWGDPVSLTVSIGAAEAERDGTLASLLNKAKTAMLASSEAGGDRITTAPKGEVCSLS